MRFSFMDAAADSLEDNLIKTGFLYGGANLISHVVTLGRDNDVNQWGIDPILGVHKANFDVYVNGFRWSKTVPKWAETDVGISKLWQLNKSLKLVSTYEHAFIHYGTDDDKYGLTDLASLQFIWTNSIFDFDTRYEYDWGHNQSSILEFSIGHEWDIYTLFKNYKIEIEPRFYWTYLGGITYPIRFFKSNALAPQPFQIANYEIEVPFRWRNIGQFEWALSFLYDIPQNVLEGEGAGRPVFYVTASVVKVMGFKKRKR
jgi:hypothetical protein